HAVALSVPSSSCLAVCCPRPGAHRDLPSFPTRRSSDLDENPGEVRRGGARVHDLDPLVASEVVGAASVPVARRIGHDFIEQHLADRKSTRLNSSHVKISYAVFCLKKKKISQTVTPISDT